MYEDIKLNDLLPKEVEKKFRNTRENLKNEIDKYKLSEHGLSLEIMETNEGNLYGEALKNLKTYLENTYMRVLIGVDRYHSKSLAYKLKKEVGLRNVYVVYENQLELFTDVTPLVPQQIRSLNALGQALRASTQAYNRDTIRGLHNDPAPSYEEATVMRENLNKRKNKFKKTSSKNKGFVIS